MITPLMLIPRRDRADEGAGLGPRGQHLPPARSRRRSRSWGCRTGARAGLTGAGRRPGAGDRGARRQPSTNLLPGPFETDRLRSNFEASAKRGGVPGRGGARAAAPSRTRPNGSATRRSSARPAPSCAAPRPASSPGQNLLLDWRPLPGDAVGARRKAGLHQRLRALEVDQPGRGRRRCVTSCSTDSSDLDEPRGRQFFVQVAAQPRIAAVDQARGPGRAGPGLWPDHHGGRIARRRSGPIAASPPCAR